MKNEEKNKYFLFTAVGITDDVVISGSSGFCRRRTNSAVYEEPESPAVTYNMNVDWKFKKAADGSEYPLAKASASVAKDGKTFTMQIMMTAIGIRSVYRIR